MKDVARDFSLILEAAGWRPFLPQELTGLDAVCVSDYAAVGLVAAISFEDAEQRWSEAQAELVGLRLDKRVGRARDLYLVIAIQRMSDDDLASASKITSDVSSSRKLIMEISGRPLREAIEDLSLLAIHDESVGKQNGQPDIVSDDMLSFEDSPVSPAIMEDLAGKGADRIVNELLERELARDRSGDET